MSKGKNKLIAFFLVVFFLAIIIGALAVTVMFYSKFLISLGIGQMLGARVTMEYLLYNPQDHAFHIKNFRVYNPEGFDTKATLAEAPDVAGTLNPKTLLTHRKFHIPYLNVYIKTLAIVKNKQGEMNVDKLTIAHADLDKIPVQIDKLIFSTDNVVYKDYTKGTKPRVEIYNVNIKDKSYENISSVDRVASKILVDSLSQTAIKGVAIVGIAAVAAGSVAAPVVVPVAAAGIILSGKDTYYANIERKYEDVYKAALVVADEMGNISRQDKTKGIISGNIDQANVIIKLTKESETETNVAVTARKLLLAKPRIAGGVLYEIQDKLQEIKK